ncbi:hypothetical protein CARUB_v10011016mg [Capsella rubella]|uniref:S-protein homolog n=1 Tax=Capsella rubella TaxID=81985 RepID=R0I4V1_9BRAS|nr:S-protein homolog 5 [Capsella rubella]EOA37324.1 hypothetical protein CARUB_v10011016mg [Capsella rubella]
MGVDQQKVNIAFLFVCLLFGSGHGKIPPFWRDTFVTMTNSLGGPPLTVHCKSKQDDLGTHVAPFHQNYQFKFQPNIWKSTLYFCSFQWDKQFKWFDIFDAVRDQDVCKDKCNWDIRANGPCRLDKKAPTCFPWK